MCVGCAQNSLQRAHGSIRSGICADRSGALTGGPTLAASGPDAYPAGMSIAVGADLFGCLFDAVTCRYVAKSLGKVSNVDGDSVTCAGLVFHLRIDHVYVTRADAERAAARLNAPMQQQGEPSTG